MKKLAIAVLGLAILAIPALAENHAVKHKVTHHATQHATNPYIKHPHFKAHRHHHKKV